MIDTHRFLTEVSKDIGYYGQINDEVIERSILSLMMLLNKSHEEQNNNKENHLKVVKENNSIQIQNF